MLPNTFKGRQNSAQRSPELPTAVIPVARPLTIQEVAEYLDVSVTTVRRWISAGKLRAYRYGPRHIRVEAVDLEKFKEQIAPSTYEHVSGGGL